jgi:hypothetical protein
VPYRRWGTHRRNSAGPGDDGRADGSAAPGRGDLGHGPERWAASVVTGRRSAAAAEERASQSPQRREERDTRAPAPAGVRGIARGELEHQQRRFRRLALRNGGAAQHCEMAVEARTGRTAPTCNGRHTRPAAHRYLFHVTPTRTRAPGPGRLTLSSRADTRVSGRTIAHVYTEVDEQLPKGVRNALG